MRRAWWRESHGFPRLATLCDAFPCHGSARQVASGGRSSSLLCVQDVRKRSRHQLSAATIGGALSKARFASAQPAGGAGCLAMQGRPPPNRQSFRHPPNHVQNGSVMHCSSCTHLAERARGCQGLVDSLRVVDGRGGCRLVVHGNKQLRIGRTEMTCHEKAPLRGAGGLFLEGLAFRRKLWDVMEGRS